jgi:hypothetical protein
MLVKETVKAVIRQALSEPQLLLDLRDCLLRKRYAKGEALSDRDMKRVLLTYHKTLPQWNYPLMPSRM